MGKSTKPTKPVTKTAALAEIARQRGIGLHIAQALRQARGIHTDRLRTMPEGKLRRAVQRLSYPDLPRQRIKFRLLHLQCDPTAGLRARGGAVSRRTPALHHQDSLRLRAVAARVAGIPVGPVAAVETLSPLAQPGAGGIDPRTWTPLGPGNVGGRTRAIVPDPDQANRIWLGSAGGGVWRSDDDGASWLPADDMMANLAVCALAMSPVRDSNGRRLMLAATGEGFGNGDAIQGAGIFASFDGANWTQLASTTGTDFQQVNRIAISSDGTTVLAATPAGLFRSTTPQLSTWAPVLQAALGDVRFHPTNASRAAAGSLSDGSAYYSTDGGVTWAAASHVPHWGGRVELTYAAANSSVVYVSLDMNGGSIWKSTDGGQSYTAMASQTAQGDLPSYLGNQGWYANTIWAGDPGNVNAVLVGGLDLWRSMDGGATLQQISQWDQDQSVHADHHCIVSSPQMTQLGGGKKVYFGNDGGIFRTDDYTSVGADTNRTAGWLRLDNGYGVTQFYGVAGNVQSGTVVGGAQDNGTVTFTPASGVNGWTSMFGGDGGWCAADPSDTNYFYGEYVFCQIHRSHDGGKTAEYICGLYWDASAGAGAWLWRPAPFLIPDAKIQSGLFIAPFVLDPGNPSRLLAGAMSLWRTNDAKTANDDTALTGPTWTEIKPSIGSEISCIAIAPDNSDIVWVGHLNGAIFVTTNATTAQPQWQQVGGGTAFGLKIARYCSSIHIAGDTPNTVYVTFAAYRNGVPGSNVWHTPDGGASWTDIGQALPDAPVHKISRHPTNAAYLYVGTEIGLFASGDAGVSWAPTNEGPTNAPVYDLIWMANSLVSTTHGRGMWRIAL